MTLTVDAALLDRHGLTAEEYERIVRAMGRTPNLTELGIYSVMWSEHCSYKSSKIHLKTLPTAGPRVVQGPGENAGAVDIGDGLAAVFKIESHNHPSFIEPYQGAATGVGGIIRDIFTMGARPIALLNSLRFGDPDTALTRRIVSGVVSGIAGYGNSIGIPTVGGEVAFDECYQGNPLVNVLCLGVAHVTEIVKGRADGVGNPVYYVGAKTGRDGIHGATMASAEFDESSSEKRPAVQVGDPFMEKLLLEACLEVMKSDALVGIQDMGAAGLTCSTSEMGARSGTGVEIDTSLVPQRETGMTPYEIMLSESQERMLLVVKLGREHEIEEIFEKWDLHAVCIGTVIEEPILRVRHHGELVAEIPNTSLVDDAPLYDRPTQLPAYLGEVQGLDVTTLGTPPSAVAALDGLLTAPNIASKRWIYRQYDHMVRTNTLTLPDMGTPCVRVKGTPRAIAMSVDGNGRYCYLDPREGARAAVAEAARNVACAGGRPLGATNNLNFANPQRPEIMWQFVESVRGIGDACRALGIPITGGNVSLYNETEGRGIFPTPVLGVVGLIDDASRAVGSVIRAEGLDVILLGTPAGELGGSEYLRVMHGLVRGRPPRVDLERERALCALLADAAHEGVLHAAQDASDGGLAVAIAELTFGAGVGVDVDLPVPAQAHDAFGTMRALFGETAGVAVVVAAAGGTGAVLARANDLGVPARVIGRTGGATLRLRVSGQVEIDEPVARCAALWRGALEARLGVA